MDEKSALLEFNSDNNFRGASSVYIGCHNCSFVYGIKTSAFQREDETPYCKKKEDFVFEKTGKKTKQRTYWAMLCNCHPELNK